MELYSEYFGPSSFKHSQLTQQTACNFGQSWPELVWIPICYYFDTTVRHQLGMDWATAAIGRWLRLMKWPTNGGDNGGIRVYRDQWMSEGFADMSASLYLTRSKRIRKKFIKFWNDERDLLLERKPRVSARSMPAR